MENLTEALDKHKMWLRGECGARANLRGANLSEANLRWANLSRADLNEANLSRADLSGADLRDADLRGADMRRAILRGADLSGADLRDADLRDADLRGADMRRVNLRRAVGIASFGPVGSAGRIGHAVKHGDHAMVQLGCFWDTEDAAIDAIAEKYGGNSTYAALVRAACAVVMEG